MNEILNRLLDELQKSHAERIQEIKSSKAPTQPYRSSETKDLYTALAKAQAEMPTAGLNAANPYFKSRYADLAEIVRVSRPALTKHGLSVTQQLISNDDGSNLLITTLAHSSGQWVESRMRILPPKNDIQSLGATITYIRRFSYASLISVTISDEDDDGETVVAQEREAFAKGVAQNNYKPKEMPYETITREQLIELELELSDCPDICERVLDKLQIQSLADMPKARYSTSIQNIRQIKLTRANANTK